jgi:hypothetical protein
VWSKRVVATSVVTWDRSGEVIMSTNITNGSGSISPKHMLQAQNLRGEESRLAAQLTGLFLRGNVAGDDIERVNARLRAASGNPEAVAQVKAEINELVSMDNIAAAMSQWLKGRHDEAMQQIRSLR